MKQQFALILGSDLKEIQSPIPYNQMSRAIDRACVAVRDHKVTGKSLKIKNPPKKRAA